MRSYALLIAYIAIIVALNLPKGYDASGVAEAQQPDKAALGHALSADFNKWNKLQSLLPTIDGGAVKGDHQRAAELLKLVVRDYSSRATGKVTSIAYSIYAGGGGQNQVATGVSAFRIGEAPIASYAMAIGEDIDHVDSAVVLVYTASGDKAESATIMVSWATVNNVEQWVPWRDAEHGVVEVKQVSEPK